MKPLQSPLGLIILLLSVFKSQSNQNNVCLTFNDYYTIKDNPNCWYDFAADLNVTDTINNYGYDVETHKVVTPDGYILTIFRIPNRYVETKKGPVFLQHGQFNSAANFLGLGRDSLAIVLADAGYDVWLGNNRGSEYSEEHLTLTVYDKRYWDYGPDHLGLYDTPAQLEYVADITGQRGNIAYIGHSLGGSSAIIFSSSFPEYAKEITKMFILMAPASRLPNLRAPFFRILKPIFGLLLKLFNEFDLIRLVSHGQVLRHLSRLVCLESPLLTQICLQFLDLFVSGPTTQRDAKTVPVFFNQAPAGSTFKIFPQIIDAIKNNSRQYDYGIRNFEVYGTKTPPEYNLTKIIVPTFLFYSTGDFLITKKDTRLLYKVLQPKARLGIYEVNVPYFNHLDFLYGRDAKSIVYDRILKLLDEH